jgi:TetR/AcrR family transcriptional regulator, regulator of autoinduction and epiphytic fitness
VKDVGVTVPYRDATDPRVERTRQVVLEATIALIVECGYGAVNIEAVAARSGVAKSTIYRHWPSRLDLIHDAFHELKPPISVPSEGSVRDRVVEMLEILAEGVASSTWSRCLPALIDAAERDPDARELHRSVARAGRQSLVDLLVDGQQRGELPAALDPELMAEALAGPIIIRRLFSDEPLAPEEVRHLVDQVLHLSD